MARNLGPKHRLCRRVGEKLCDLARCPVTRRNYPPGVHGPKGQLKLTEYGTQLLEKQKARHVYGLLERQFRNTFEEARRSRGDTGHLFLELLERRLDNVVFRLGFCRSHAAARQAITHRHITVNGRRVMIPSYVVRANDVIAVHPRQRSSFLYQDYPKAAASHRCPAWLAAEPEAFQGRILRRPSPEDITVPFQVRSIVEFYSR